MLRRTLCSALLGLSVLGGTALAAAPAQAAGSCILAPPARIVINAPLVDLSAKVSGGCTSESGLEAAWYSQRANEDRNGYADYYSGDPVADLYFYDDEVEYGVSRWIGEVVCRETTVKNKTSCVDADYTQSASNTSDVRAGTVAGISGSRSGGTVSLAASSYVYSLTAHRQVRRSAAGTWQVQERRGTTWRSVKNVRTPTTGITSVKFYSQPAGRKYRFVLPATSTSWTGVSRTVAP